MVALMHTETIAYHFGMWISPRFQLLLVKEYQRLKTEEQAQLGWSAKRELSKINYRIHTDAIKQNLIPAEVTAKQTSIIYADEADTLNVAMFGMTAKMWRKQHPRPQREYSRLCFHQRIDLPLEYGKPQCCIHRPRYSTG